MDDPATSIRSGSASARSRSSRANDSAFVLDIAGLPVLVSAAAADHFAILTKIFGTVAITATPPEAEISFGAGDLPLPARSPDERQPDLEVWHDGDVLHLASEPLDVRARVTPTQARIVGGTPPREQAFRRVFQPVITHMLAYRGIFVLHAASMRKGDRGVLALGETGKGKSTLALAAFQHDWRVMGDDLVALWIEDDTAMIRGLPKPMALPQDVGESESRTLEGASTLTWDHRRRLHVPVDQLDLGAVALGAILVVEHGDTARSVLEPVASDRIASTLMGSYTSVGNGPLMRAFFPVASRAARVVRGVVRHGTDAQTRLGDAQRILADIAASW